MKTLLHFFSVSSLCVSVFFAACNSKELDRETALKLIKEQNPAPQIVEEEIYTADPEEAKRILNSGLEKEGLLTVQRVQSAEDVGKPMISFTEKAKPYLLPLTIEDKKANVQRVKIADQEIGEVTGIQLVEGDKKAEVEYTTRFKNITPFYALSKQNLNEQEKRKANFVLYDDGWRME